MSFLKQYFLGKFCCPVVTGLQLLPALTGKLRRNACSKGLICPVSLPIPFCITVEENKSLYHVT
jgi:hypothetical protein